MADMKLFLELLARSTGLKRELSDSSSAVSRFTQGARREFASLKGAMQSVQGQLAALGLTVGVVQQLSASARLDKGLIQVKQTAGESIGMVKGLRSEFFSMARDTGRDVEGLKNGFDSLIQSGQTWKAALESTKGINIATAVTGANEKTLAGGLTVGATAFNIDLEKPGKALELLDKMTVAGRQGNAELENLSDIFARVGVNAASAGMSYDKTLGFIEALSMVERQPERLATLADSTLRVFTNLRYMAAAQAGTGVRFFDAKGARRDSVAVLQDIKTQYDKLTTDKQRALFIQKAFGKADLDTIKGIRTLLSGDSLDKVGAFTRQIAAAGGTLNKDLPEAVSNAVDQTGRLKAVLRKAADDFAQPINQALADWIKYGLDKKGLTGGQLLGGGVALAAGAYFGGRALGGLAGRLLTKGSSTALGVAEGKALQAAAGVTPVFVTNWPAGGMPTPGGTGMGGAGMAGLAAWSLPAAVVAAPFVSKSISDAQRRNGWSSEVISRSDVRNQVMGIGGYKPKNDIKLEVNIDNNGRVTSRSNDLNTSVNTLNRGAFFGALMTSEEM